MISQTGDDNHREKKRKKKVFSWLGREIVDNCLEIRFDKTCYLIYNLNYNPWTNLLWFNSIIILQTKSLAYPKKMRTFNGKKKKRMNHDCRKYQCPTIKDLIQSSPLIRTINCGLLFKKIRLLVYFNEILFIWGREIREKKRSTRALLREI